MVQDAQLAAKQITPHRREEMKMSSPRLTKYAATAKPMMVPICRGLTRRIRTTMNTRAKSASRVRKKQASGSM